ncbi:MAG: DUF1786 domain-containing protein [Chloroflexota bacterium]
MQILCVDVGTGTQDILLFDSDREIENCVQIIAPSPTRIVADRIRRATARRRPVVLTGRTMGGGPSGWAAEDHLRAGLPVFATADAARTFDDELEKVERLGVKVVSERDAARLDGAEHVVMGDLDLPAIADALARFDVEIDLAAIAVAVFDHGNAPPGVSDRTFRFEYIAETVARNDLTAFAYRREDIPERLTRMRAVAESAPPDVPTLVMDTGPAAIVGALEDPTVGRQEHALIANLGNFHTLAFHLDGGRVRGIFEHHTGELTREKLERYLGQLADGSIANADVFADMGHGALVVGAPAARPEFLAVTGPRRALLSGSSLARYLAVPHGDMMLAGCYGLLRAVAKRMPEVAAAIETRLDT